jgi:hypothetical protein
MAQVSDLHLANDPARDLYRNSAFVHGYIHGYESGFARGDLDLHLGHDSRVGLQKVHAGEIGYRSDFGDQHVFLRGFRQGLTAGYGDAFRGDAFRAVAQVRRMAGGMVGEAATRKDFDQGVSAGYEAGRQEGLKQPLTSVDPQGPAKSCLEAHRAPAYCDAFGRGFGLGYADGSVEQMATEVQTAQARESGQAQR